MWKPIAIMVVVALLGWGLYNFTVQKDALEREVGELRREVQALSDENRSLASDIEYYQRPENLLKELKSQFNYREAGEGLIIVVPASPGSGPDRPSSTPVTATSSKP